MEAIIFTGLLLASASARHFDEPSYSVLDIDHNFGVIGGTPVNITEVPSMALFRKKDEQWGCGASIVHKRFLVTAGHCVVRAPSPSDLKVTVGTDKIASGEDVDIENIFVHPNRSGLNYDIAVIKLKKDLKFSDRVNLIKMADSSAALKPGDLLKTYGFGITENHVLSDKLLGIKIPFVDLPTCRKLIEPIIGPAVTDRMLCAGVEGKTSCQGDSGGPLVYEDQLIGVVSWGVGCGAEGTPSVYASVPSMLDFIQKTIKDNA